MKITGPVIVYCSTDKTYKTVSSCVTIDRRCDLQKVNYLRSIHTTLTALQEQVKSLSVASLSDQRVVELITSTTGCGYSVLAQSKLYLVFICAFVIIFLKVHFKTVCLLIHY